MAEVLWSGPGGDYEDFYERLQQHYPILEEMGVQYGLEAEPVSVSTFIEDDKVMIKLEPGLPNLRLEYAYDTYGFYTYEQPFQVAITDVLQVQAYKSDEPYGRLYETEVVSHLGLGRTDSISAFSPYYTAGGTNGLTDGLTGSLNFRDGRWMGFSGVDADVTLDFSREQELSSLSFHYYLYPDAWIMQPKYVSVYASINGENWVQIGQEDRFVSTDTGSDKAVCTTQIELKTDSPYRFLRVVVKNFGKLPDNHAAAGSDAWIFMDEIIVR
jgi:hexosaminidase